MLASGRALARNGAVTLDSILVDSTSATQNNTSEFSAQTRVSIPVISINDVTLLEGNAGQSNAVFTVSIVANRDRPDRITIYPKGTGANQIHLKGLKVLFGDQVIGTITGGRGNTRPDLLVTFNNHATTSAIDNLMRRLNFHVQTHVGVTRTVNLQVTNIGGIDSNLATRAIAVVDIR